MTVQQARVAPLCCASSTVLILCKLSFDSACSSGFGDNENSEMHQMNAVGSEADALGDAVVWLRSAASGLPAAASL